MRIIHLGTCFLAAFSLKSSTPVRRAAQLILVVLACLANHAFAADIVIGHVAGYTGPVSKDAGDLYIGAKVFFDSVNERGGVNGQRFRIEKADDRFDPHETRRLVSSMVGRASALLPIVGSAGALEVIRGGDLDSTVLPIVGVVPGAESSRAWQRNIFHFRASDADQISTLVKQLVGIGFRDIGLLASQNPFGLQGLSLGESAVASHGARVVCKPSFRLGDAASLEAAMATIRRSQPQALIVLAPPQATVEAAKALHRHKMGTRLYALSYADHRLLFDALGSSAAGIGIVQVMPNIGRVSLPIIKAFHEDYRRHADSTQPPSYFNLEGYISAKLIYEAIRLTNDVTADGVRRGLEQMVDYDLGGFKVQFSTKNHAGSRHVDLSVVTAEGKLRH